MTFVTFPTHPGLHLNTLRTGNLVRLPRYTDARGERIYKSDDLGSEWNLSQWSNACFGELGEAANIIKKIERGDFTVESVQHKLGEEFADTLIYLDILALRCGVDLGLATIEKFNRVSDEKRIDVRLNSTYTGNTS